MLDQIDAKLGQPIRVPHGDPIPQADGTVVVPKAVSLVGLQVDEGATIARFCDDDSALLRYLYDLNVGLDYRIRVLEHQPFGSGTRLEVSLPQAGGRASEPSASFIVTLGSEALRAIWVVRDREGPPDETSRRSLLKLDE